MDVKETNSQNFDEAVALIASAASNIFSKVGLRPTLGRVWAALYISERSLNAKELQSMLGISSGALSMALGKLGEMGFVHREISAGSRQFFYRTESDMWSLITRLFKEHERAKIVSPLEKIKLAERLLEKIDKNVDPSIEYRLEKVRHLVNLGEFVVDLLDVFIDRTRVEVKAAQKWLSVSGKLGGESFSRLRRRINAVWDEKRRK